MKCGRSVWRRCRECNAGQLGRRRVKIPPGQKAPRPINTLPFGSMVAVHRPGLRTRPLVPCRDAGRLVDETTVPTRPPHLTQAQLVQALGFYHRIPHASGRCRAPPPDPTRPHRSGRDPRRRERAVEQRGVLTGGSQHQHLLPAPRRVGEPGAEHGVVPGPTREHHDRVHSALPGAPPAPRAAPALGLRPHDPVGRACEPTPSTTSVKRPPLPSWPRRISPAGAGRECCRSEPLDPRRREWAAQFSTRIARRRDAYPKGECWPVRRVLEAEVVAGATDAASSWCPTCAAPAPASGPTAATPRPTRPTSWKRR